MKKPPIEAALLFMGEQVSSNPSASMFPDVDVLVLIADLEELVEVGQHQFYQLGIEVLTFLLLDQRQHLVQRPGLL